MQILWVVSGVLSCGLTVFGATEAAARGAITQPIVEQDGTVDVPAFILPFSNYASTEARRTLVESPELAASIKPVRGDTPLLRQMADQKYFLPLLAKQKARYDVVWQSKQIAGVYTEVFVPRLGELPLNRERVLLNLHGGGFRIGARTVGRIESIPISATARIKVISVDYRMAPESKFPAASEDVAKVYTELLKTYRPENIGIYGCSAGGLLTAESLAWFQKYNLPTPGAVGIFHASTHGDYGGDSGQLAGRLSGDSDTTPEPVPYKTELAGPYFSDVTPDDPLVAPGISTTLLAHFPPTLFITGSRSFDMSGAARSQIELTLLGVEAQLSIWDGMMHGFIYDPELPESREAYQVVARFFAEHLGRQHPAARP